MLTFERLPAKIINGNPHYYFYMRSHNDYIISVEMDPIVLKNGDLPEILEFLMYSTKGHVVAPVYLYMIWEEEQKIDDHGNFYFSFNSLTDYMLFKLGQ